jgi:hypothetical protein
LCDVNHDDSCIGLLCCCLDDASSVAVLEFLA